MTDTTPAPIGADALRHALEIAEAALADIGDADREPGDDVAWCEARATEALPTVRAALASAAQPAADDITPSEAVFAFAAWLTCRDEAVTLGSAHNAAGAAELAGAFVASQGLAQPRDDYHQRLRPYPAAAPKASPAAQGDALDAARYRWLRKIRLRVGHGDIVVWMDDRNAGKGFQHHKDLWGEALDAAIDAALDAKEGPPDAR